MNDDATTFEVEQEAFTLRRQLAQQLADAGDLRSPGWRAAVEAVPRHEFLPEFFTATHPDNAPSIYQPASPESLGVPRWLELVYSNETWITQLDGHITPRGVPAGSVLNGVPTSSSSLPGLVVDMWERLHVGDGHRVLEIGTGTGYSTALGCHRLGDTHVTSIEVDPDVAGRARATLDRLEYHPTLVIGDGATGAPAADEPFDAVIATCSWPGIPAAWIDQTRTGGTILVTLSGWIAYTLGLAELTVTGPGAAEGTIVAPHVSFMPTRGHAPGFLMLPDTNEHILSERRAQVGPDLWEHQESTARRVLQLAAPNTHYVPSFEVEDGETDGGPILVEAGSESYAAFTRLNDGGWVVRQGGQRALWDTVEPALLAWRAAGEPALTEFRIAITRDRQTVSFPPGHSLDLPPARRP